MHAGQLEKVREEVPNRTTKINHVLRMFSLACAMALLLDLPDNTTFRCFLIICPRLSLTRIYFRAISCFLRLQRDHRPISVASIQFMRRSGIGAVLKKNGKLRMIHHLSSPEGTGANDSIPAEPLSLHYVSIDNAMNIIMSCPQPVYLSKLDVRSAFRQIPVRRQDFAGKAPTTTSAFCVSAFALTQPSLIQ